MRNLRSIVMGLGIAIFSTSIIIGSFSLAMLEGTLGGDIPTQDETSQEVLVPTVETIIAVITSTILPPTITVTLPPTITMTLPPTPEACLLPPDGWIPITVRQNESLDVLAQKYQSSIDQLGQVNCLTTSSIMVGSILYVPPLPSPTLIPCGPPSNWIIYIVKSKDNLFQISTLYQTTVPILQAANCMGSSTLIITGQSIFVPNVATITPTSTVSPTVTSTATSTSTPTETSTPTLGGE